MAMNLRLPLTLVLAILAGPALSQSACDPATTALTASFDSGDVPTVLGAWAAVQASADCPAATVASARSQTSAVIARAAQGLLAAGDVDGAEAVVLQAPGMHWAVQAVRGDIAAKRGQRDEAAQLYNAALDTLGDPGLTVQSEQLEPVAERLAKLAQENMMLAGSMKTSVARGGKATGVMGMVSRGLTVEKVPAAADPAYVAPKEGEAGYVAPDDPAYVAPTPDYDEPDYVAPEYNVVAAAAARVETVFLPIRFDFDSDRLDATGLRESISLSEFLKANHVEAITIIGHTDDVGDENYNLDLSLRRAESLAAFLVSDGVQTAITVVGKGEFEPPLVVDAQIYSVEEFRTIARRVEVAFGDY
jgi:outer membrane protein OmpA-like peptidoglycan-associated protein